MPNYTQKMKNKLPLLLFILVLIVSCNPQPSIEDSADTNQIEPLVAYPLPDYSKTDINPDNSPYPINQPTEMNDITQESTRLDEKEFEKPISSVNSGAVYGKLLSITDKTISIDGVQIYIADIVPIEPNGGYVFTIQQNSSPQTVSNRDGRFSISGITPGEYALMLVTPIGQSTLLNENRELIKLNIKAGDVIDLGDVYANWP